MMHQYVSIYDVISDVIYVLHKGKLLNLRDVMTEVAITNTWRMRRIYSIPPCGVR